MQKYKTLQLRYFRNIHVYGHTPDSSVHTSEHTHVYTGLLLGLVCTFCQVHTLKELRAMVVAIKQPVAECSYYRTLPASLCSDNTQNLRRSTVERIPNQCPHQRSKVSVLTTHQGGTLTP